MKEGIRVVHLKPSQWPQALHGLRHLATRAHYTLLAGLALFLAACAAPTVPHEPDPDRVALSEHILLAEMARARGESEWASEQYAAAMRQGASLRLAREAARYGATGEHWPNTLPAARRWVELAPDSSEARWYLGMSELMAGETQAAVDAFSHWLGEAPGASDWQILMGELQALPRRWRAWEVARKLVPEGDSLPARRALARMAMSLDRLDDAARHARRALASDPQDPASQWLLLRIRARQGVADALRETDFRLSAFKTQDIYGAARDRSGEALELTTLLWEQDRLDDARDLLHWALSDDPGARSLAYALALVEIQLGALDSAEARLEGLARQGYRIRDVWLQLAFIAEEKARYREALRWYDRVQSGPDQIEARARAIALLFEQGQADQARQRLQRLEQGMGENRHAFRVTTGAILLHHGPRDVGEALCRRAQEKRPRDADAYYQCALALLASDRHSEQGVAWLRRAHELWPEEADFMNALGYSLADQDRELRYARQLIRQALEKRPDNAAIMDSMGWVAYRLGNLRTARRWLERAWEARPTAEIAAHLVEVRWHQGQQDQARALNETAVQRWPDNTLLRETWKRLQES